MTGINCFNSIVNNLYCRVHTVITDDAPPKADSGVKATPHEVVHPVAEAKSPSDPPPQRKKMLAEAAEHDPGEVRNQQMGHWEGQYVSITIVQEKIRRERLKLAHSLRLNKRKFLNMLWTF